MPENFQPPPADCPNCGGCSLHASPNPTDIPVADLGNRGLRAAGSNSLLADSASDAPLQGARFALASLGLFLVPVLLAMAGALWGGNHWGGGHENGQFLGASAGLLLGMAGSMVVARMFQVRSHAIQPSVTAKGEAP